MQNEIFVHDKAICETRQVGAKTRIWAFSHILPDAKIGENCNICEHVFIENNVIIGNNVTIKSGVQLWDGVELEDNTFIGPNVTFTNDHFPRSKEYPEKFLNTTVHKGASIGANATILPGIEVGQYAMVGAGSVVTMNIPAHAIVVGNPAKIIGFNDAEIFKIDKDHIKSVTDTFLSHVKVCAVSEFVDNRGNLTFFEFGKEIPFLPKRSFMIFNVPTNKFRGNHAHREGHQFVICIKGSVTIVTDDGYVRQKIMLDSTNVGLHIQPKVWNVLYDFSENAAVIVFTSEYYDREDYINQYPELIKLNCKK